MREVDKPASPSMSLSRQREALLEAVDQGLAIPGEIVRAAIYERIERSYQVKREDIPENLEGFHKALEELLGAGARVIERQIAKNFYSRLDLNFTARKDWTIVEYFDHAKKAKGGI